MHTNSYTFRLFKKMPSFTDGVASLVDMSPIVSRYNQDATENQADINSLRADWYAIGADLHTAINEYARGRE
ncbi:MAG: hypothetical protein Q7S48_00365 [bacterium]|nr:hypothetical protein [bacterium]